MKVYSTEKKLMGSRHSAPDPSQALPSTKAADLPSLMDTPLIAIPLWVAQTYSKIEKSVVGELNPNGDARKVDLSQATIMFAHPDGRPAKEMTVAEFILGVNEGLDGAAKTVQEKSDLYKQYLGGMVFDNSTRFTDPHDLSLENAIRSLLHKSGVTTSYRDGAFKIDLVGVRDSQKEEPLQPAEKQLAGAPDNRSLPGFHPAGLLPGGPDETSGGPVVAGRRPNGNGGAPAEDEILIDCSAAQYHQLMKLYSEETMGADLPRSGGIYLEDDGSRDYSYYDGVTLDVQAVEVVGRDEQLIELTTDVRTESRAILEAERTAADVEFPADATVVASPRREEIPVTGGAFTWTGPDGTTQFSIAVPTVDLTPVSEGDSVEPQSRKLVTA